MRRNGAPHRSHLLNCCLGSLSAVRAQGSSRVQTESDRAVTRPGAPAVALSCIGHTWLSPCAFRDLRSPSGLFSAWASWGATDDHER